MITRTTTMTNRPGSISGAGMLRVLLVLVAATTLAGCSGGVDRELRNYVEDVLARKAKPLPRPDPPPTYVVYTYKGEGRDPFEPFYKPAEQEEKVNDPNDPNRPVEGRLREELEQFPLDSMSMVGTLEQDESVWGILITRDGTVYRVQVGNYLGQNYGKIIAILEDRIELEERAQDGQGKWHLREASIALAE